MHFFPFTFLCVRRCVFGRAGGVGGLHRHHMCIPSFPSLPPVLCCSSWLPGLGSQRLPLTWLTQPLFSASPYARRCIGQMPLLPHSRCGSVLRSQNNFMPGLALWVLGFLGHWKPPGRCGILGRRGIFQSDLQNGRLLIPTGVLQALELNTGHCQSVYLCSVTK